MSDEKKPNGRKYTLTKVGLAMTGAPVLSVFILAGLGKVTADVSAVIASMLPPYFLAVGALVGGFQLANSYTTGKAADNGLLGPPQTTETTTEAS